MRPASDLLGLAWARASATGAEVRLVGGAARDELAARGGIGAVLRF